MRFNLTIQDQSTSRYPTGQVGYGSWGRRTVSTLRWDADALVVTWRIQGSETEMTISFRYELQDGGRRLRAAEQIRGGGRDQDNQWVFERP